MDKTEKQKLAEDNHKLIYSWLNSRHLNVDEWYDIAALGYMKAVNTYSRESNSKFSSWAYKLMDQERSMYLRKYYSHLRLHRSRATNQFATFVSLDNEITDYPESSSYHEIVDSNIELEKTSVYMVDIKENLKYLSLSELKVLKLRMMGYTLQNIGEILGISYIVSQRRAQKIKSILIGDFKLTDNMLKYLEKDKNKSKAEYQDAYKEIIQIMDNIYYP